MEFVYFTLVAIVLYIGSDWLLDRLETQLGRRFEHRTVIFFTILLTLAVIAFWSIRTFLGG